LRGDFFVLASLSAQTLMFSILNNWSNVNASLGTWRNMTKWPFGLADIPRPAVFGLPIPNGAFFGIFATIVAVGCALVLRRLMFSPWGRLLLAVREDELAARGLGKNTRFAKVQAFAISGALAAVAGALYAAYVRFIDPSTASLDESILMLSIVIVGGLGNFRDGDRSCRDRRDHSGSDESTSRRIP
jgi:branched-chain amino acid transport system permease protein